MFSQIARNLPRSETVVALMVIRKDGCSINFPRRRVFTQPRPKADITIAPGLLSAWSATVVLSDERAPAIDVEDIAGRVGVLHEIHVGGGEFIRLADARHG